MMRYDTLYDPNTGKHELYVRPDVDKLTFPARLWVKFFDWLEKKVENFLDNHHPTVVAGQAMAEENYKKFKQHGDYLRQKYPERYAEALAEIRSEKPY